MNRASLRLSYHRGTTAHVASIYPFSVQGSFGHRGTYVGLDLLEHLPIATCGQASLEVSVCLLYTSDAADE